MSKLDYRPAMWGTDVWDSLLTAQKSGYIQISGRKSLDKLFLGGRFLSTHRLAFRFIQSIS